MAEEEQPVAKPERDLQLPDPVVGALTRYAETVRKLQLWEAASWPLAAMLGSFTLVALADRWLFLEDGPRYLMTFLVYACGAGLAGWLVRRAFKKRGPAEIAQALEESVPDGSLEERISTTVELAYRRARSQGSVRPQCSRRR